MPLALLLIFVLLFTTFGRVKDAVLVFTGVPLALTGGVAALVAARHPALDLRRRGVHRALGRRGPERHRDGLVHRRAAGARRARSIEAIVEGSIARLRPVLMTALVASLGFLPMAIATGTGAEVQRPLATVVIGGILSSTALTLLALPVLYRLFHADVEA